MCVDPTKLPEGIEVACRYCWQCRANRVNDLVGRCIAEQTTSTETFAVTLTYRGTGPETAMLRYSDFQKCIKLLRRHAFNPRYIVAGEFGSKKGRAHWHAVLFFDAVWVNSKTGAYGPARVPQIVRQSPFASVAKVAAGWDIVLNQNMHWHPWPHGFAFFQQPDYGGFAYVLKYALKDQDDDVSKGHLAMSKKPPLGHQFFMELADRHVEQGLAPQDLFYSFPHVFDAKRKRRAFLVQGTSRENYLNRFADVWRAVHGTEPPISSELVAHWDKLARAERALLMTDAEWFSARSQWPVYYSASGRDCARWMLHEGQRDEAANWRVIFACVPPALRRFVPDDLQEAFGNGDELAIEVLDTDEGLNFFVQQERLISWHANADEAPMWREWIRAELAARPASAIG